MAKRILLRILVFCGVLVAIALGILGYYLFDVKYYLFGAGDAAASAEVWLDEDGDGRRGATEPPLEDVCVWGGYASDPFDSYTYHMFSHWEEICSKWYHRTDEDGAWFDFYPGGSCDDIYIFVKPPEGYQPTTPLAANGCSGTFGLTQDDAPTSVTVVPVETYLSRRVTWNKLKRILTLGGVVAFAAVIAFVVVRPQKAATLLLSLALLLTACGPAGGTRGLLTHEPCAPPCWQGITPGQVAQPEAVLRAVRGLPGARSVQAEGGSVTWFWRQVPGYNRVTIAEETGVVQSIALTVDFSLTVASLVGVYGPPDAIDVGVAPLPEEAYATVLLYYPAHGFYATARAWPDTAPELKPESPVVAINLAAPAESLAAWLESLGRPAADLPPWPGYGALPEP